MRRWAVAVLTVAVAACGSPGRSTTSTTPPTSATVPATSTSSTEVPATSLASTTSTPATSRAAGWPMFHADDTHSGVVDGAGRIDRQRGPVVAATYRIFDAVQGADALGQLRWTSTLPLGDVNGDGTDEIVVTTPDWAAPLVPTIDGSPLGDGLVVLTDRDGALVPLWRWDSALPPGGAGLDTYSPALVDADGDGLPDVVFTARDGIVRALDGATGALIWDYDMGRITEAGPMVSDLDGDGRPEVIVVTDCPGGPVCADAASPARLVVLPAQNQGRVTEPAWQADYGYKMDSAEPVVVEVPGVGSPGTKVVVAGTWGGELVAFWRDATGMVRSSRLALRDVVADLPAGEVPVIRTSPLGWQGPHGPVVFFGWLPTDQNASDSRFTGVRLEADSTGAVSFAPQFTIDSFDIWKSSPALVPTSGQPLVVAGYGLGIGPPPTQSGPVGFCDPAWLRGGTVALHVDGSTAWQQDYGNREGNLRASAAMADLDGDGRLEVVIPSGCGGSLRAFDAVDGTPEWVLALGPVTQTSPSIGDVDGDGALDIVVASYDGLVRVLTG